jgi:20S proteasome alpha/beta subunit
VIGIDPIPYPGFDSDNDVDGLPPPGTPTLYRSDPGGTVDRCDFCAIGSGAEKAMDALESIMKDYNSRDDDEGQSTERQILAQVITKVALAALNSENDPPSGKRDNNIDIEDDDSIPRVLDIWFISTDPKNRGGAKFRVARSVVRESLDEASEKLIQ